MPKPQLVDVTLQFLRETDKAIHVTEGTDADAVWLPKSQIEYEVKSELVEVTLPRWLAAEKKFAGF
jgi:hypothetical protein